MQSRKLKAIKADWLYVKRIEEALTSQIWDYLSNYSDKLKQVKYA